MEGRSLSRETSRGTRRPIRGQDWQNSGRKRLPRWRQRPLPAETRCIVVPAGPSGGGAGPRPRGGGRGPGGGRGGILGAPRDPRDPPRQRGMGDSDRDCRSPDSSSAASPPPPAPPPPAMGSPLGPSPPALGSPGLAPPPALGPPFLGTPQNLGYGTGSSTQIFPPTIP
ncbi:basic salivary proline-rich protein 2-like [Poecile atricapillus]|uniref:basic salivary proline-rich protein 2-like n=1 Tax=Poecile atricapillus TaxID=48891 RepID=UPI00273A095E|nr:basic salivary proline-rich protein 2-like [Poecile atricapillus]